MAQELVKLSPSKLGRFLQCPACFWREYHGKMPPSFPLPGILGKMDALTKAYYDNYRRGIPPSLKGLISEKLVCVETVKKLRQYIKHFDEKLNAVLQGKMDDCMVDSSGRLVPIDNKTASPSNDSLMAVYQVQLDAYAFILQKNGYETADYGYLIYYVPMKGTPDKGIIFEATVKKIALNPERIPKIMTDAVRLVRQKAPPKIHKDCECPMCKWMMGEEV